MKTFTKVVIITLVFAIPAFLLGRVIWPPDPMLSTPTSMQLPFFIFLSALEAITFGLGVSFIIFVGPMIKLVPTEWRTKAWWSFMALTWLLVSWWPHDNLHQHNGMNLQGLLYIEYGFHLTLIIAGFILAYSFATFLKKKMTASAQA